MSIVGKFNNLEYIMTELSEIPISSFVRFPKRKKWHVNKKIIKICNELGYPVIFRSDDDEDGLGKSFAGYNDSKVVESEEEIEEALNIVRYGTNKTPDEVEIMQKYAESRGMKLNLGWKDFGIQKYNKSTLNVILTQHPHIEDSFLIDIKYDWHRGTSENLGGIASLDTVKDFVRDIIGDGTGETHLHTDPKKLEEELIIAIEHHKKIKSLPEYKNDGIAYQEELTIFPYTVSQWRPCRQIEIADFNVYDVAPKPNRKNIFEIPLVFGIAPKEGIELLHFPVPKRISQIYKEYHSGKDPYASFFENNEFLLETGVSVVYSLGTLGKEGLYNHLESRKRLPDVTLFFNDEGKGIQSHNEFRVLERGTLVGFTLEFPHLEFNGDKAHYWSDGRKGIIKFEKIT